MSITPEIVYERLIAEVANRESEGRSRGLRQRARKRLAAAALLLAAFPLHAAIRVTQNGDAASDSEVCAFRAIGTDTPFHQLLGSTQVICPAQLPPGLWNVFARRGRTLVSSHTVLIDSRKPLPDIELRLEPAAAIVFHESGGFAYVTDSLSAFPAGSDGVALVPAGRTLVPLIAKDAVPLAIGKTVTLTPGTTESIAFDADSTHAIATWLAIAPADMEILRRARWRDPPLVACDKRQVLNPVHGTVVMNGVMQFCRGVFARTAMLELGGAIWKQQSIPVDIPQSGVIVTRTPLRLVPASSVLVKWSARSNLFSLTTHHVEPCVAPKEKKESRPEAAPALSLLSCPGHMTGRALELMDRGACTAVGRHEWQKDQQGGEIRFGNLDPGAYVVEFTFGDLPPIRNAIRVDRFEQQTIPLDVDYLTQYGRVTVGGAKVSSQVKLRFGFIQTVYSNEDGDYEVVLKAPLKKDAVVSARSCDGLVDGEHIIGHDVLPNARYDIDFSANHVRIDAIDASTGNPIPGALIRYGVFNGDEPSSRLYFRLAFAPDETGRDVPSRTGSDGSYVIRNLPPDRSIRICLEHPDYERTCAEPFTLTSTEERTIRMTMKPRNGFSGRIAGVADVSAGQIFWFASDGHNTETTSVSADGGFRFNQPHVPGEAAVFVSNNFPLFAFWQPAMSDGEPMIVTMPTMAARSFRVEIGSNNQQRDAIVTIAIGDLVVPYPAFAQHLALHGSQLVLRDRGLLLVPDILATGPIFVILGPPLDQVTDAMRAIDLFRLPQFASLPRKPVSGIDVVFNGLIKQ